MINVKNLNKYRAKADFYLNRLSDTQSKMHIAVGTFNQTNLKSKKAYKAKKKFIKQINRLNVHINKNAAKYTEYTYKVLWSELLNKYHTQKLTSDVYHDFIEYIESANIDNAFPYAKNKVFFLNRWVWKINKLTLKVAYFSDVKLNSNTNRVNKIMIRRRIKLMKKEIQSFNTKINDTKQEFFSKYHSYLVKKMENLPKDHNVKKIPSNYVIDLHNVCKYYNNGTLATKVLKNINLKIKYGEFVVILGPSGSGKTTLLNIISGMDNASYGKTIVCGENLINYNNSELTDFRRRNIGYVFQQYGLLPNLTIRENVEIGANLQSVRSKRVDIDELLKLIGIYEHRNKFPFELSGGQQQRVSIARSIAKNPNIIFGDEPTGAIDEQMSKQVMQLFLDVNKKYKTTIIIVTHNPIFADIASVVIKVNNGTISSVTRNNKPKKINELKWSD